jgi:hypothetical protein
MAISWGSWDYSGGNGMRVGIDVSWSTPAHTSSTAVATISIYTENQYSYSDSQTLTYSDDISGTTSYTNNDSGGAQLRATKSYTYTYSNYGSSPGGVTFTATVSGAFNGVTPTKSLVSTVPTRPYGAPAAPTGCAASRNSDASASVTWADHYTSGEPYTSITLLRNGAGLATLAATATSYTDNAIAANSRYNYAVRGNNSIGSSAYSTSGYIWTTPGTPTNVLRSSSGANQVITWTNHVGYAEYKTEVWASQDDNTYTLLASVASGGTSYTHVGPADTIKWKYVVRAVTTSGPALGSAFSAETTQTPGATVAPVTGKVLTDEMGNDTAFATYAPNTNIKFSPGMVVGDNDLAIEALTSSVDFPGYSSLVSWMDALPGLSVTFIMKTDSTADMFVMGRYYSNGAGQRQWWLTHDNTNGLVFNCPTATDGVNTTLTTGVKLNNNLPRHLVLTVSSPDGSGLSTLKIFVDGVMSYSRTITGSLVLGTYANAKQWYIGRAWAGKTAFKGTIDEVAIWRRELTVSEADRLYKTARTIGSVTITAVTATAATITASRSEAVYSLQPDDIQTPTATVNIGAAVDPYNAISGATAKVSGPLTGATASTSVAAGYFALDLSGATATILQTAPPSNITLANRFLNLAGQTAMVQVLPGKLMQLPSTYSIGDHFEAPYVLSAGGDFLSGTFPADIANTTVQTGEPDLNGGTKSYWARYTTPNNGVLRISSLTTNAGYIIDVYQGSYLDTIQRVSTSQGQQVEVPVSGGVDTYIRVLRTAGSSMVNVNVDWAMLPAPYDGVLHLQETRLFRTPGAVVATLLNFNRGITVTFELDGDPITANGAAATPLQANGNGNPPFYVMTDETGGLVEFSLPIARLLQPGTYTLTAIASGSSNVTAESASSTLTVVSPPLGAPSALEIAPTDLPDTTGSVQRWVFQDPMPGGLGTYQVPWNPSEMTSPFGVRPVTSDATTSPHGQLVFWEGTRPAQNWSCKGYLETQEHYEKLLAFSGLNRRFWVVDHRGRGWVVTVVSFNATPHRNATAPWAHDYELSFLIYRGPVQT